MTSTLLRIGVQTPRVAHYPAYDRSAASEVIDLARVAGLVLDPWQRYVLEHGLGELDDGAWAATKVGTWVARQNGKGGIIEALELGWLFLLREPLILHSAHEYKTSSEAFRRIKFLIENCPDLDRCVDKVWHANGEQGIELTKKAGSCRLRFVARSRTSGRGFSGDKNILDEGQELTADQMAAMMPTLSARRNPQLWFFGTPPDDAAGWCYNLRADGESGAPRMAWFDWGADLDLDDPDHVTRLDDRDLWYATNPALGIRIGENFVEDERRPSGLGPKFASERLGVWPVRADPGARWQILTAETWDALVRTAPAPVRPVLSVEVALDRSRAVIGAAWDVGGISHIEVVQDAGGVAWVINRLLDLSRRYTAHTVALDAGTEAWSLATGIEAAGLRVLKVTGTERAAACAALCDAAVAATLSHDGNPALAAAVAGAVWKHTGDGARTFTRRGSGVDIAALYAVTFALHGLTRAPGALVDNIW